MLDWHDDWNLVAIGALNIGHIAWWLGAVSGGAVLQWLFYADCTYLVLDSCWLLFVPTCVAPRNRGTLLMHHLIVCGCMPIALAHPVLQRHLLRTWVVEVHSWNHIASRRLPPAIAKPLERINKPMFVALRLISYPLTWFAYAKDRAMLPEVVRAALIPGRIHWPLTSMHFLMYGLMLHWGKGLLLPQTK